MTDRDRAELAHLQDANEKAHHVVRALLKASYPLDHELVTTAKRLARLTDEAVNKW